MDVLVVNGGSSSLKWRLLDSKERRTIRGGKVERLGAERTHESALKEILQELGNARIEAVGHRVVHGGERFRDPAIITDEVLAAIEACVPLAPLHNPANLAGIRAARAVFPNVPHVAVFDTAFHHTLPRRASTYAIDQDVAARHSLRRFGFHGTSHAFVCREAAEFLRTPLERLRIVSLHLGNGASACAVERGRSVETSMGTTPLEGLVMGTRSGDLDPGAILTLLRSGMSADEVDALLNKKSGLAGLSGHGNDLRDIEERAASGDERARLAIAVFAHRARKYLGAYAAVMGGLDAVVVTGGIGENGAGMRRRILQGLEFLGLVLDDERNLDARVSEENRVAEITSETTRVRALVVATDEELAIAEDTARVVAAERGAKTAKAGIPIAVSARHVHLDQATLETLFGPGAKLTPKKPLSQPGQFACEETVSLVGPRRRIDGVRILGPVRKQTQIEISRTDEFFLGVDAPVRGSGDLKGSGPITLEGPKGSVQLREGLIRALRHIHASPDEAKALGFNDGDYVAIAVTGGPRDLVFGDVLVRVHKEFKLEMHLDTDEGNAADLPSGYEGCLIPLEGRSGKVIEHRPTRKLRALSLAEDLLRDHAGPR